MMAAGLTDEVELKIERLIPAPPERVFALWVEPEQWAKWLCPGQMAPDRHAIDPRVGGQWLIAMRYPDGRVHSVSGAYRVIDPPRRLVFTWTRRDAGGEPGPETEVTVTFTPAPGGTRMVLHQRGFTESSDRDMHGQGWGMCFDKLVALAG